MTPQLPPEGISQQAWDEAGKICDRTYEFNREPIARAIDAATAAERERCALIADDAAQECHGAKLVLPPGSRLRADNHAAEGVSIEIVKAIRQGFQPSNAIPLKGVVR